MTSGGSCGVRIVVFGDGRVFDGSPMDILRDMRTLAFAHANDSIGDYVRWLEGETGLKLSPPKDEDDGEAAALTIAEFERAGLVRILEDGVSKDA